MTRTLRQALVSVLVLLQLFAPLVHAHTGNKNIYLGLHVPGLESYRLNENPSYVQKINGDWAAEGLLIVVDAGIKIPQDFLADVESSELAAILPEQLPTVAIPKCDCNFSPHYNFLPPQRYLSSSTPRAPPA